MAVMTTLKPCPLDDCAATDNQARHHYHGRSTGAVSTECGGECDSTRLWTECYSAHIPVTVVTSSEVINPADVRVGDTIMVTRTFKVAVLYDGWGCARSEDDELLTSLTHPGTTIRLIPKPAPDPDAALLTRMMEALDCERYPSVAQDALRDFRAAGITLTITDKEKS